MKNLNQTIQINGELFNERKVDKLYFSDEPKDSWENAIYAFLVNWYDNSNYITASTSGSTGKPKLIQLSKQSMINSARTTNKFFGLDNSKTALLCLPASYIAGKMMLVRALVGGFNIICVEPTSNPFHTLENAIDFAAITPFQLTYSLETLKHKNVNNIIVGGGQVNKTLESQLQDINTRFFETYGMTETCSHIALRQMNGSGRSDNFTILEGITIRCDQRHCLVIKAPHLLENEIITNDIVELKNDNSFRWLGRMDTVINSGGIKIFPETVERKISELLSQNYFITSIPDKILGSIVVLVIESEKFNDVEYQNFLLHLRDFLEKYEIPKRIFFISRFTYTRSDKILKKETLEKALLK